MTGRKKGKKIRKVRTGSCSGRSATGEDLGSLGGCDAVCWWRRKVYVGASGAEDTVGKEGREGNVSCNRKGLVLLL